MAHIVTANCNDCKYTDCCVVCPVECFYQDQMMLYIDPEDCIDCEACVPECPVEAIFRDEDIDATKELSTQGTDLRPSQVEQLERTLQVDPPVTLDEQKPWKMTVYIELNKKKAEILKPAGGAGHITEKHELEGAEKDARDARCGKK